MSRSATEPPPDGSARRRRRVRLTALLLALLAGPLLAEGLLRWLLFSSSELAARWGKHFRDPGLYVATSDSEDRSKLQWIFAHGWRAPFEVPRIADAELGWVKPEIDPVSHRHAGEAHLFGRRPVLLYGSSFAACMGQDDGCFEQLLEASELGRHFCLLNYGVTAHGLDQTLLLLQRSVDRYAALDPVIVIAFVLESDLDRCTLSFFTRPKPRFRQVGDAFVLEPPADVGSYLDRHPPSIQSYLWRYLLNGIGVPLATRQRWEGEPERRTERDALTGFVLQELERACAQRHLEHFVLLFHTLSAMQSAPAPEEDEMRALLERLGLPRIDTRALLEHAQAQRGCTLAGFYGPTGHPSGLGTAVLFEGLARGLRCELDGTPGR